MTASMTADEFRAQGSFEDALRPGDEVEVRWTHSHGYYGGPARIVRVNEKSVRAALLGPVAGPSGGWRAGNEIVVPRLDAIERWSANNGVFPPGGWRETPEGPVAARERGKREVIFGYHRVLLGNLAQGLPLFSRAFGQVSLDEAAIDELADTGTAVGRNERGQDVLVALGPEPAEAMILARPPRAQEEWT
jgi:hypothetical protein